MKENINRIIVERDRQLKKDMKHEGILNTKSLKEQVYDYLRKQIHQGNLQAGTAINMDVTSKKLGISKTPLRDALLQLEIEGFVSIAPRKGIYVNGLTVTDIQEFYQVIAALESSALTLCFNKFKPSHIDSMRKLNQEMETAIRNNDFNRFYKKNLAFHNTYIELSGNSTLITIVNNLKKRLYDFVPQEQWIKEWEESSIKEHERLIDALATQDLTAALHLIVAIHWSFEVQEKFIRRYYAIG